MVKKRINKKDNVNSDIYYNRFNNDGFFNILSGIGTRRDKTTYNSFTFNNFLDDNKLKEIWCGGGIANRIVDIVADDCTSKGFEVKNDSENIILNKLNDLKTETIFNLAYKFQRHYGGALIVLGINDGNQLSDEVDIKKIKSIDYLKAFNRTDIILNDYAYLNSVNNFGNPTIFTVLNNNSYVDVHTSRCLVFKSIPIPQGFSRNVNNMDFWGVSDLQRSWQDVTDFANSKGHIVNIIYEFIIGKYGINNLAKLISENQYEKIEKLLDFYDRCKSTINSLIMDSTETYTKDSSNVSGLNELMQILMMSVSSSTSIPVSRLFGRSVTGMNSTGEVEEKNYYDMIIAKQRNEIAPSLNKLINLINMSNEVLKKIDNPSVIFNPLIQMTEKEKEDMRLVVSNRDKTYIEIGVLSVDEVRESRFKNGYSTETIIDEDLNNYEENIEGLPEEV